MYQGKPERTILSKYRTGQGKNTPNGEKKSLLRRLKAQTLPDATPSIGKIHFLSKMVVPYKPLMGF